MFILNFKLNIVLLKYDIEKLMQKNDKKNIVSVMIIKQIIVFIDISLYILIIPDINFSFIEFIIHIKIDVDTKNNDTVISANNLLFICVIKFIVKLIKLIVTIKGQGDFKIIRFIEFIFILVQISKVYYI